MFAAFDAERVPPRTRRHPYHPEVLGDSALIERAIQRVLHEDIPSSFPRWSRQPSTWGDYSELAHLITASSLRTLVDGKVAQLHTISQDPAFNIGCWCGQRAGCACSSFIVEHHASGLRARCHERAEDGTWGIFPKPWNVGSPSGNQEDGQRYVGLGIGRWLYTVAASRRPRARWRADAVIQPAALAVRQALHRENPFIWDSGAYGCDWCRDRKLEWGVATQNDFLAHPVMAPRRFPAPRLRFFDYRRTG